MSLWLAIPLIFAAFFLGLFVRQKTTKSGTIYVDRADDKESYLLHLDMPLDDVREGKMLLFDVIEKR